MKIKVNLRKDAVILLANGKIFLWMILNCLIIRIPNRFALEFAQFLKDRFDCLYSDVIAEGRVWD